MVWDFIVGSLILSLAIACFIGLMMLTVYYPRATISGFAVVMFVTLSLWIGAELRR